jgi:hypothetical protein
VPPFLKITWLNEEDEPLNADESEEQYNLILTEIEKLADRNRINASRMAAGNTIPANEIFARGAIVALFIPKPLRLLVK